MILLSTMPNLVKSWFGNQFTLLHPLLQQLHLIGGCLSGRVNIEYGSGLAGVIGRRIAKKMNLPSSGQHNLSVYISHQEDGLHWGRCFNSQQVVESVFKPVGTVNTGYWIEETGPLRMRLTVDIINGGWHWRCTRIQLMGIFVPRWLLPVTSAYKNVEYVQDKPFYRFHVSFSLPYIGMLVKYSGLLDVNSR
ncbi:DUF4166 domain-containing protein [Flocculibacter collagenilyticus]|uniref:DUF4166 domain-containing protein n=1 Tax=Flocculibacter collagenilyticus TaxID=2744479 RepID=UPI0018F3073E|nr:DUF4166 domain-containing protein [Flocculibacter collagenilyticus]